MMSRIGDAPVRVLQPLMRESDAQKLDPQKLIQDALQYGAEAIILNCGGFSAWYPTQLDCQRINPHMQGDLFGELMREAKRAGLQVIARLDLSKGFTDWHESHPDWFALDSEGAPASMWGLYETCFTGPYYQEKAFQIVEEILTNYDVDGIFINFFRIKQCHCARCQEIVQNDTGGPVPADGEFSLAYHRWRQRSLVEYTERLVAYAHSIAPSAQMIAYHHVREGWDMVGMAKVVDLFSAQASNPIIANPIDPQPKWTYWPSEQTQLGRALKPDKAPMIVNTYSAFFASRRTAQPPDRLVHDIVEVAAHGGTTVPALNGTFEQDDPRALPALEKLGKYLLDNRDYYQNLASIAKVALVYSPDSALLGNDNGSPCGNLQNPGHIAEFRGFYEMLVQSRHPFDLLVEGNLQEQDLAQYSVIILPGVCCISGEEAECLDRYVQAGGQLLVTADSAIMDKEGKSGGRIILKCVDHRITERIHADGAYLSLSSQELVQKLEGTSILGLAGEFLKTTPAEPENWRRDLHLIEPVKSNAPEFSDLCPATDFSGIFSRKWGEGEVRYLPWRMGALFHQCASSDYVKLFQHYLEQGAGESPVVTDAPCSVEVTCYDLEAHCEGPMRVLHFLNATALQGKTLTETIRLPGFRVDVKGRYTKAKSLLSGESVPVTQLDGVSRFSLSSLETFDAIALW